MDPFKAPFESGDRVETKIGGRWVPGVVSSQSGDLVAIRLPQGVQVCHRRIVRVPKKRPTKTRKRSRPGGPWRSGAYLDFVRARACASCGAAPPSVAHHWGGRGNSGGMALKCSDAFTVPLCNPCHRQFHDTGAFPGQSRAETEATQFDAQRRALGAWVEFF